MHVKAALLTLAFSVSLLASPPEPKVTIHRTIAGVKNSSGWIRANSTMGKFSIDLPAPYIDFSAESRDKNNPVAKIDMISTSSNTECWVRCEAEKLEYKPGHTSLEAFKKAKKGIGLDVISIKEGRYQGYPCVDLILGKATPVAHSRIILVGPNCYILSISWNTPASQQCMEIVNHFLGSPSFHPE